MKPFFKPEDFLILDDFHPTEYLRRTISDITNKILWERSFFVYRGKAFGDPWSPVPTEKDTHSALLFNIQELPKKECKHEPAINPLDKNFPYQIDKKSMYENICARCGIKLKAKWEPISEQS